MRAKVILAPQLETPVYAIYCFVPEKYKRNMTKKELRAIHDHLLATIRKFPEASFLLTVSTTDTATAVKYKDYTGRRGRPKTIVEGDKVLRHAHIRLIGNKDASAYKAAESVRGWLNKRYSDNIARYSSRGKGEHAMRDLVYCYKQADFVRTGGDFDFGFYNCRGDAYVLAEAET